MVTIGENLQYRKSEVIAVDNTIIVLKESPNETREIAISELKNIEIAAIKSASGFSGSMEWSMRNPTFILPTTIWNNIISLFKRRNDTFHFLVTLADDTKIMIYSHDGKLNQKFKHLADKNRGRQRLDM